MASEKKKKLTEENKTTADEENSKPTDDKLSDQEAEKIVIIGSEAEEEVLTAIPSEEELEKELPVAKVDASSWQPKTAIGKLVKDRQITNIDQIIDNGTPILETELVDILLPNLSVDLLLIGQAKGKFGGGQRRVFKQTQKKTQEGNKPKFAAYAIVGDENGHVGIGYGKSKETVPAREKSIRNAKKGIIKIRRGCGSWECNCKEPHSVPFKVRGKCGSVIIELMPAPKGTGLAIQKECAKILKMAGIKDVWSKTFGTTSTSMNLIKACEKAIKQLSATKMQNRFVGPLGVVEGSKDNVGINNPGENSTE